MLSNKLRITALLLALLCTCTLLGACSGEAVDAGEAMLLRDYEFADSALYKLTEPVVGSLKKTSSSEAFVYYPETYTVVCGFDNATLVSMNVERDQVINKGDIIAQFDIAYSQTELESMKVNLRIAEMQYAAQKTGYQDSVTAAEAALSALKQNGGSENAIKIAALKLEAAKDNYDYFLYTMDRSLGAMQEKIDDFETAIAENTVYSPVTGIVKKVEFNNPGKPVSKSQVLCVIYTTDIVWVYAKPEDPSNMRYNMTATVDLSKDGSSFTGRIISAPDILGQKKGSIYIKLDSPDAIKTLVETKSTLIASAVAFQIDNVLLLENGAINRENEARFVYIYEDGIQKKRYIGTGLFNVEYTQILEGLTAGQSLVKG